MNGLLPALIIHNRLKIQTLFLSWVLLLVCSLYITYADQQGDELYINPPFESVEKNNIERIENLMHFKENYGNVAEEEPPIIFVDLRILSVDPSVDDRISNLHIPHVVWGWGEDHMERWEYTEKDYCCGDEYERKIIWRSAGDAELVEAVIEFEFNGMKRDEDAVYKQYSFENGTIIDDLSELGLTEEDVERIQYVTEELREMA